VAVHLTALHGADLVVVVPAELGAGVDVLAGEEGYPRKAQVVGVHEHVLHVDVGRAAVVEEAADVAAELGVHDEHLAAVEEVAVVELVGRVGEEAVGVDEARAALHLAAVGEQAAGVEVELGLGRLFLLGRVGGRLVQAGRALAGSHVLLVLVAVQEHVVDLRLAGRRLGL